jgi:YidC/Oxa1 family membrane protein insertase
MFDTLIVQPIFNLLLGLYAIIPGGDFGISLIVFTVLVRFALWPLVKKQLHQTKAIKKLQPELAKIKKQAKGNKQQEGLLMMEVYKKHGINPFRSLGILLVQLPIFIALYRVIQIITTERERVAEYAYGFVENIPQIRAIIDNPSQFNESLFGFIDLTETALTPNIYLLLIAIGAAALQYFMAKQTMPTSDNNKRLRDVLAEAADGKEADQSEVNAIVMRKMLKFLPIMLFFIVISVPGALALYIAVSNLVGVLQQRYILNQDEDELMSSADKAVSSESRVKKAKEAKIVTAPKPAKSKKNKPSTPVKTTAETTVTRISAKDTPSKTKRR